MRLTVEAPALRAALDLAGKLIAPRQVIQALGCVRLRADGIGLRVEATDLHTWLRLDVAAAVDRVGEIALPAAELAAFAKMASGTVALDADDDAASISFGRSRTRIALWPLEDLPVGTARPGALHDVDGSVLADALRFASPAMSRNDHRFYLNGIRIDGADGADVVATNGHQIHRASLPGVVLGEGIIPAEVVPLILDIAAGAGGVVRFSAEDAQWRIEAPGISAHGAAVDGSFPDWRRIVRTDGRLPVCVVDAADLARAVKLAVIGSDRGKDTSAVLLTAGDGGLAVSGASLGQKVRESVTALSADVANPVCAGIAADYLGDAISAVSDDSVAIFAEGEGAMAPLDFEPAAQRADLRKFCRVMPMRVASLAMAAE